MTGHIVTAAIIIINFLPNLSPKVPPTTDPIKIPNIIITSNNCLLYSFSHIISRDLSLGHRVGFYQMKGNVGRGNFSNVKMAIHSLTKGKD